MKSILSDCCMSRVLMLVSKALVDLQLYPHDEHDDQQYRNVVRPDEAEQCPRSDGCRAWR